LFEKWLCLKERGTDFSVYFKKNGFNNIAIYGVGKLAEHLIYELENTEVNIVYGIDKNKKDNSLIKVFSLEDKFPKVDAVVITIMSQYYEIAEILDNLVEAEMITIEEVIYSLE
jgi:hypothetical protein